MTNAIRLTTAAGAAAVQTGAIQLLTIVKMFKNYDLAPGGRVFSKPEEFVVSIEAVKGTINTLSQLCERVDVSARPSITPLFEKTKQKLQFVEKVMGFILGSSEISLDPRIEKLLTKLTQMQQAPLPLNVAELPSIFQKLSQYSEKMGKAHSNYLPTEIAAFDKAKSIIGELELRVLQATPMAKTFELNLHSNKHDHYYEDPASKKMAGACYSAFYLNASTFGKIGVFLQTPEDHVHEWTAEWIKKNPSKDTLSLSDALVTFFGESLYEVPFPESILSKRPELRQTPLSYPPNADKNEIQRQLDTLIELKNNASEPLGAFIEIGSCTFAIVFQISGRICLYNPYGVEQFMGDSYQVEFANSGQAAESLKGLTTAIGPDKAITLKPYRNLAWKVQAESSESSGEEDNEDALMKINS